MTDLLKPTRENKVTPASTAPVRILGRENSFNVRKVLWVCDEIRAAYTREDFGRSFAPTNTADFLRLNPTGQVPVVIDGDRVMRESNTIVRYLAGKHKAIDLYPEDPEGIRRESRPGEYSRPQPIRITEFQQKWLRPGLLLNHVFSERKPLNIERSKIKPGINTSIVPLVISTINAAF